MEDRTIVTHQLAQHPLRLFVPPSDAGDPAALLYLGMIAGGLLAGDRMETTLTLGPGAQALATTQSASKILTMEGDGFATQHLRFDLADDAMLEYLPDEVIPFPGANAHQELDLHLAPTARALLVDMITPGRIARDESFQFHQYRSRLQVWRANQLILRDVVDLRPSEMALPASGLLGTATHYASLVVVAPEADRTLADDLHTLLDSLHGVHGSASVGSSGLVIARLLGPATEPVKQALSAAWRLARKRALGRRGGTIPGKRHFEPLPSAS